MLEDGFDYNRTVASNRLVFKGQFNEKLNSYFFMLIMVVLAVFVSYNIFDSQISNNPSRTDYIVAIVFPVIILLCALGACVVFLNRDKLKEIEIKLMSKDVAKATFLDAASNLKWEPITVDDNYIVFKTKFGVIKDCQTITLIFFPDNRIFFNSLNYPNDYIKPARFEDNYDALVEECRKKEIA